MRRGFTLIELLAVIVILAIIALISTPIVMNTIEKSRLASIKETANNIEESAEIYFVNNRDKTTTFELVDGKLQTSDGEILEVSGDLGEKSGIKINKYGHIYSYIYKNGYCTLIRGNKEKEQFKTDSNLCNMDVATNLVKNGYGEYKDNTNFSKFTYDESEIAFKYYSNRYTFLESDKYIEVDPSIEYTISATAKTSNTNSKYYSGITEYDVDKNVINATTVMYVADTTTTLARPLNNGDTKIYLDDASKWNVKNNNKNYQLGVIFWNYKDSIGYVYPTESYSRNAWYSLFNNDALNGNIITLNSEWNHGYFPTGTPVSQSSSGSGYNYGIFSAKTFSSINTWESGGKVITDILKNSDSSSKFRFGVKSVRWFSLDNYTSQTNLTTYYKDIIIREND